MRIEVVTVPECPSGPLTEQRLAEALAGRPDVTIERRVAATAEQAAAYGMRGSPTVLIDGRDPFAVPGAETSLSCRLYRDEHGRVEGAPGARQLRAALAATDCCPDEAPAEGGQRAVHQAALRAFARTGRALDPAALEAVAAPLGVSAQAVLAALAAGARAGDGPSAAVCCGYLRFFATSENAEAFAAGQPEAPGRILGQQEALTFGEETFGPLLVTGVPRR